jgi:hypothetical protein
MFFDIPADQFSTLAPEVQVFLALAHGFHNAVPSVRGGEDDKEFHFQNWVKRRIQSTGLSFDPKGRNGYPDFILDDYAVGFEVKGLAHPGRVTDFDCNSQLPLAEHDGRKVFYIFGRYPQVKQVEYPVYDLVLCSATFLNTETSNSNKNQSFMGAGSYGDIRIRDRRMYVCKTPYALLTGTEQQATLILDSEVQKVPSILVQVGEIERLEADALVSGYSFDLQANKLSSQSVPNQHARTPHRFTAFKVGPAPRPPVQLVTSK